MSYAAKILADSITNDGCRLTTFEVTMPRIVLAEFNTHRMLSRNSASSRAIPVEKRIAAVEADPFVPDAFGRNQPGMQATVTLADKETALARRVWLDAAEEAVAHARALAKLGVHKQLANRVLEPYLWHTVIVSATEWDNLWGLRCHPAAQPEVRKPVEMMRELWRVGSPTRIRFGQWHTPMLEATEAAELAHAFSPNELLLIAIGRCARVSYLTHDGKRDPRADIELAMKLRASGHMSPFEHVAQAVPLAALDTLHRLGADEATPYAVKDPHEFIGNFRGWQQFRKTIPHEDNFSRLQSAP